MDLFLYIMLLFQQFNFFSAYMLTIGRGQQMIPSCQSTTDCSAALPQSSNDSHSGLTASLLTIGRGPIPPHFRM